MTVFRREDYTFKEAVKFKGLEAVGRTMLLSTLSVVVVDRSPDAA